MRKRGSRVEASARRVEAMVTRHGPALVRVANQFSLCHDDALDAYQRGLEIYLRRLATVEPATEGAWMRVVVKHEAMAIRRARQESVDHEDSDLDARLPAGLREVADEVAGGERVERSVEALTALKPDEARALLLKAEGLSYQEIGSRFGWTYTKVNRSIAEGRKRFLKVFDGIESGEACERHAPVLEALAGGRASAAQMRSIRPHLRHCAACRARVRDMRFSRLRRLALFGPFGWLVRVASADVAQVAGTAGGGRFGPAAALLGLCLGGGMAGAACVGTGALPAPPVIAHLRETPAPPPKVHRAVARRKPPTHRAAPKRLATVVAARTPVATAVAAKKVTRRTQPAKGHTAVKASKPVAKRSSTKAPTEFGFESHAAASPPPPAPTAVTAHTARVPPPTSGAASRHRSPVPSGSSGGEFGFEGG